MNPVNVAWTREDLQELRDAIATLREVQGRTSRQQPPDTDWNRGVYLVRTPVGGIANGASANCEIYQILDSGEVADNAVTQECWNESGAKIDGGLPLIAIMDCFGKYLLQSGGGSSSSLPDGQFCNVVWDTPDAQVDNYVECTFHLEDLSGNPFTSSVTDICIIASDGELDADPSHNADLSPAGTPLGTWLAGSGTATSVVRSAAATPAGKVRVTADVAATYWLYAVASQNTDVFVKAKIGPCQIVISTPLAFTSGPTSTTANAPIGTVVVSNTQPPGTAIIISLPGGVVEGTLTATTDMSGNATFSDLTVPTDGTYTLTATSHLSSAPVQSAPFTITPTYFGYFSASVGGGKVDIGDPASLKLTTGITLAMWINCFASQEQTFVGKWVTKRPYWWFNSSPGPDKTRCSYRFWQLWPGYLCFSLCDGTNVGQIAYAIPGGWNGSPTRHIVGTWDADNGMTLYIDGASVATTPFAGPINVTDEHVLVASQVDDTGDGGGSFDSEVSRFSGAMKGMRIYNAALNGTQVSEIYGSGKGLATAGTAAANLIVWYDFNEGPGATSIIDGSGNGNNGTPTNVQWGKTGPLATWPSGFYQIMG